MNSDRVPPSEAALQGIPSPYRFAAADKATIDALVGEVSGEVKGRLASKYEAAESISKDARWMVFSSWRPYTQSSEYQQLLEFCRKKAGTYGLYFSNSLNPTTPVSPAESFSTRLSRSICTISRGPEI